jgi:hypothetical protein
MHEYCKHDDDYFLHFYVNKWLHLSDSIRLNLLMHDSLDKSLFVCSIGLYATPTQYRSYGEVPALQVEEDLRCPSVHYFRHERAPE